jgi:uncharacterized membrane protein
VLPSGYHIPAALIFVGGGLLACFYGYRLFRIVLGVYGFILGALFGSQLAASSSDAWMVAGALLGGVIGAAALYMAYFIGAVLVGAGVGAFLAHLVWSAWRSDPPLLAVIAFALVGALSGWWFQRIVVSIATALGGAWTALVGLSAIITERMARRPPGGADIWIEYPASQALGRWGLLLWIALAVWGAAVQLRRKGGGARKGRR